MRFRKYTGQDKYHFRVYKRSIGHPFIVVTVSEKIGKDGKILISGYMMTHSLIRVTEKPKVYTRLNRNPNPTDDRLSFINVNRISDVPANNFSKPYNNWHLSKEDELLIDELEKNHINKK